MFGVGEWGGGACGVGVNAPVAIVRLMSSLFVSSIFPMIFLPLGLNAFLYNIGFEIWTPTPQWLLRVHSNSGACFVLANACASFGFWSNLAYVISSAHLSWCFSQASFGLILSPNLLMMIGSCVCMISRAMSSDLCTLAFECCMPCSDEVYLFWLKLISAG